MRAIMGGIMPKGIRALRSIFLLFLLVSAQALAGATIQPSSAHFGVYKQLFADTLHDVSESKQEEGARAGQEGERERFLAVLKHFEEDSAAALPDFQKIQSYPWVRGAGEVFRSHLPDSPGASSEPPTLLRTTSADASAHSMKDSDLYSANRLGLMAFELVRAGRVKAEVFGGSFQSLLTHPGFLQQQLVRIPSPYEAWGIQKYLDINPAQTGPARLIYVVPPILQYLEHYRALLQIARPNESAPQIWLQASDRTAYFREIVAEVKSLAVQFEEKPEQAALGYYSHWETAVAAPESPWVLKSVTARDGAAGWLHGKILELAPKVESCSVGAAPTVRVLALASDRTLWGEASAELTQAVLAEFPGLKSFFFLGSAGAPSGRLPLYALGIPAQFRLDGQTVSLENALLPGAGSGLVKDTRGVLIATGGIHGNSASPGEQTQAWVSRQLDAGVDTVDVEQSRIAEAVSRFNATSGRSIRFGAINLITDRPSSLTLKFTDSNHLDQVDAAKKSAARISAVDTVLQSIHRLDAPVLACVIPMRRRAERASYFKSIMPPVPVGRRIP